MRNITFINAGAGSGKTYRLTTDLAKKLTQGGLNPSQVILTTYTELAAAEFREKARKEILNAKDADGNTIASDVRIKSATQLGNAFIGTVHAISYRFIRKYWYLLNYGADLKPMSTLNQDFYMSQSVSEIVTDADRKVFRQFRKVFDIKDSYSHPDHLFWLPELKAIVDKMDYYDIHTVEESIHKSMSILERVFTGMPVADAFSKINAYLPVLKTRCEGLTQHGTYGKKAMRFLNAINACGGRATKVNDLKWKNGKSTEHFFDTIGAKGDSLYKSDVYLDAKKAYETLSVSRDYLPVIKSYLEVIFNLALRWQKALSVYKQENHIISFDDMEKIFLSMLTDSKYKEVQDDIKNSFRLLMVDEFQDSNPVQLKIFNRISELIAENGGESVWVGDPKQAIYGFRGSDSRFISEILAKFQFSDDGTPVPMSGSEMLGTDQLLQSWRSRPALVNFANSIFLKPFKNSGLKEKQITLMPHHTEQTDTLGNEPSLYIWRTEQCKAETRARMLAAQIKNLLESGRMVHHKECDKPGSRITYRDIAVLCFSNTECNNVASQLRKLGLPASCEETNLMQCLEVYLLKTILLFVGNPSDKMLRAELAMMLCDATTEDILKDRIHYVNANATDEKGWDCWMDSDSDNEYAVTLSKLEAITERYRNLSVYDAVVAICEEVDLNNIIVKWGDATQRRHNLSTVVNMAKVYDDMCCQMGIGSSIAGFISYLTVTKPDNKPDNSANTIKVLTYHRSKGLEWPVVILYQLWKNFHDDEEIAKNKFRGANVCELEDQQTDIFTRAHYINLFPYGIGGSGKSNLPECMYNVITAMTDGIYDIPLYGSIKSQTCEEALRLLYVGVTRAKDMLVSLTSKDNNANWPKNVGIGEGNADCPFGRGYGETLVELEESIHTGEDSGIVTQYRQVTNTPALNTAPLQSLSPSTISSFANSFTSNVQVAESDERIIDMKVFASEQSDAVKGTCIHNIFAVYKPGDDEGNISRTTQTLANFGFADASLSHREKLIDAIKWLYDYLTRTYGAATHIEKECPLIYPLPSGQVLHGEIDLLWYFKADDGTERCVLVDYKTFPGRRSELADHTAKYYPQLSAYHAALTAAGKTVADTLIYYPVQGNIRKLSK